MSYAAWSPFPHRGYRLVHLGVNAIGTFAILVQKPLEQYLSGLNGDWYRYAPTNYVVWTDKDLAELTQEIVAIPMLSKSYILATEFNPHLPTCNGWLPQQFWAWLDRYRSQYG